MSLHISLTTARDRFPVAVSGRPPRSIACCSRITVLRATAELAISVGVEIVGNTNGPVVGRRLLPQRLQTVECQQRPRGFNPAEPLPNFRVLQKVLCNHSLTRHAEFSVRWAALDAATR